MQTFEFDAAAYLDTPEDIAYYLNLVLSEGDPIELVYALGVVAKSKGMTKISRETGLKREGLYASFGGSGNPSFVTVVKVLAACGLRLHIEPSLGADEHLGSLES